MVTVAKDGVPLVDLFHHLRVQTVLLQRAEQPADYLRGYWGEGCFEMRTDVFALAQSDFELYLERTGCVCHSSNLRHESVRPKKRWL